MKIPGVTQWLANMFRRMPHLLVVGSMSNGGRKSGFRVAQKHFFETSFETLNNFWMDTWNRIFYLGVLDEA